MIFLYMFNETELQKTAQIRIRLFSLAGNVYSSNQQAHGVIMTLH